MLREIVFLAGPATVFRRLAFDAVGFFGSSSSALSIKGFAGFRTLNAIRGPELPPNSEVAVDVGGVMINWRSLLARVASADRSSGLQLMVCRSVGIRSLLNSCAATVQSTSGGGGDGAFVTGLDEFPLVDILETLRRAVGELTLAMKD